MEKRVFSDPTIPSFFIAANKPFKVIPHKSLSGQVEFRMEGTNIDGALEALYGYASVEVLDFITALKGHLSSIFTIKGGQR